MDVHIGRYAMNQNFKTGIWGKCKDPISYNPRLAYTEKKEVICPSCIKHRVNPVRHSMGKMAIYVSNNAYGENNER